MTAPLQDRQGNGRQLMTVEPSLSLKACFIALAFGWSELGHLLGSVLCTGPTWLDHWANGRRWILPEVLGYLLDKPRVNGFDIPLTPYPLHIHIHIHRTRHHLVFE